MMDLSNLVAHPDNKDQWLVYVDPSCQQVVAFFTTKEEADRYVVMAKAGDVMMRRGWTAQRCKGWPDGMVYWAVADEAGKAVGATKPVRADDPFTALVEADRWYKEHVECSTTASR